MAKKGFWSNDDLGVNPPWEEEWQGMPEFQMQDLSPVKSLIVHFATWDDMKAFAELVEQHLLKTTQSIWFPEAGIEKYVDKRYVTEEKK